MGDENFSNTGAEGSPNILNDPETPEEETSYIKTEIVSSLREQNPLIRSRLGYSMQKFPTMRDEQRTKAWEGVAKGEKIVALCFKVSREISAFGEVALGGGMFEEVARTTVMLLRVRRGGTIGGSTVLDLERLDNGLPFGRLSFEESDGDDCQSALEGDVVFMQYFAAQGVADDNTMWWRGLDEVMEANPTTTTLDLVIAVFPDTLQDDSSNASIDTATLSKQTPNLETIEISIDRAELRFKAAEVDDGYLPVDPELPTTQPLSKLLTDSVKHAFHHLQNQKPEWHEPCVDAKEFIAAIGLDLSKDLYRLLTKRTPVLTGATATKRTFGQRDSPDIED